MEALRFLDPSLRAFDEARAELICFGAFEDERPFRHVAGLLDWRLAGKLSRLAKGGFLSGSGAETVLTPGRPRLPFDKLLILGLGRRAEFDVAAFADWLHRLEVAVQGLGSKRALVELPGRGVLATERRAELLQAELPGEFLDRCVFIESESDRRFFTTKLRREGRGRSAMGSSPER